MVETDDKAFRNGAKTVKKDGLSSAKSNGVAKRDSDAHGHKDSHGHNKKKEVAASSGARSVVKKSVTTVSKVTSVKTEEKKKKVFTLSGQKHEPPEESDPCRIFYVSLHEQNPNSEMAQIWMMEHGLLDAGNAKKALEKKQRAQQQERNGTPMESAAPSRDVSSKSVSKSGPANKSSLANGKSKIVPEQNGKRKRDYYSDDDDFIAKPVKRKPKS